MVEEEKGKKVSRILFKVSSTLHTENDLNFLEHYIKNLFKTQQKLIYKSSRFNVKRKLKIQKHTVNFSEKQKIKGRIYRKEKKVRRRCTVLLRGGN